MKLGGMLFMSKNDISVVLATKKRPVCLDRMLTSLIPAMRGVKYEVIVIDGDSKDNTLEILAKHKVNRIFIESEQFGAGHHSWGELYNFGFSLSDAKWIMYCSDDIIFNENCFTSAIEVLNRQLDAVAGGMFFYRTIPSDCLFDIYGIDYTYGDKLMVNYGLIKKEAFWEVGGLDTSYKFYCADGDLCFKLYDAGKTFIPCPKSLVTHYKGIDASSQFHMRYSKEDIDKYKKKWAKYVNYKSSLDPRRLWLTDMETENED